MIYGVALLAACMFVGSFVGNMLGMATGLDSDIGGVGFAVVLLVLVTNSPKVNKLLPDTYSKGIKFWKEMYIPVTIAMAASQNVVGALNGGMIALVLGVGVVFLMMLLIPVLCKLVPKGTEEEKTGEET